MSTHDLNTFTEPNNFWVWLVGLAWTVIMVSAFVLHLYSHDQDMQQHPIAEANTMIDDLIIARAWNSMHGGVYVRTSQTVRPNPCLAGLVTDRDITTDSGVELTLINPAYMTRQLNELLAERRGRLAHITSLNPIRPENSPDAWEAKALKSIRGMGDYSEVNEINGEPYMRVMRTLLTEKSCLKCHAQQGYREGDIRGGISASIPLKDILALHEDHHIGSFFSYGFIWLVGLAGVYISKRKISVTQQKNRRAASNLIDSEKRYRELYENSPLGYQSLGEDGCFIESNPSLCWMLGYSYNEIIGKSFADFLTPESAEKFKNNYPVFKERGEVHAVPFDMIAKDGHIFAVEIDGRIAYDEQGKFKQTHCVIQDVTLRKQAEGNLLQLNSKLEELSFLDGLTGIPNRRMFDLMLHKEWSRCIREKQPLSLVMIDIDSFKEYNDQYGHLQGDECLKSIARALSKVAKRAVDLSARYGGDEFVLLFPNTDKGHALRLAEVCRQKVMELDAPHEASTVCNLVTISVGVASTRPVAGDLSTSLIEAADKALYQAKERGCNRVEGQ